MDPNIRNIDFYQFGQTVLSPVAVVLTLLMCVFILRAKKGYLLLPLILVATEIPNRQRLVVAGLDFSMVRFVILAGWARILFNQDWRHLKMIPMDKAFLAWVVIASIFRVLRDMSMGAVTYRAGVMLDSLGIYFLLRTYIRTPSELVTSLKILAWVAVPVAMATIYEIGTGRNAFYFMGGLDKYAMLRDGRVRASGAVGHPILAGSLGASLVPIFIGLYFAKIKPVYLSFVGAVSGFIIMFNSGSSGPALSFLMGCLGWALWPARRHMRQILLSVLGVIIVVHFIREKPVWHLIGRLSQLIGGTGFHRSRLIDAFVGHFSDWALRGTRGTASWGWGLQDTTNWYVAQGVNGGLATLVAFVVLVVVVFRTIGAARRRFRTDPGLSRRQSLSLQYLAWGMGVSMATHALAWISVGYFAQVQLIFFMQLALTASLAGTAMSKRGPKRSGKRPAPKPGGGPGEPGSASLRELLGLGTSGGSAERRGTA